MQEGKIATICSCNQEGFFLVPLLPLMLNNPHPFIYQHRQSRIPLAYYNLFTAALSSCNVVSCVISPHFATNVEGSKKVALMPHPSMAYRPIILF